MESAGQKVFTDFMDFIQVALARENPMLIELVRKRYEECDEEVQQSERMIQLLQQTQSSMESEKSRVFVHLKDLVSELKACANSGKKKAVKERKRKLSTGQNATLNQLKDLRITLERLPSDLESYYRESYEVIDTFDVKNAGYNIRSGFSCLISDGGLSKADVIRVVEGNEREQFVREWGLFGKYPTTEVKKEHLYSSDESCHSLDVSSEAESCGDHSIDYIDVEDRASEMTKVSGVKSVTMLDVDQNFSSDIDNIIPSVDYSVTDLDSTSHQVHENVSYLSQSLASTSRSMLPVVSVRNNVFNNLSHLLSQASAEHKGKSSKSLEFSTDENSPEINDKSKESKKEPKRAVLQQVPRSAEPAGPDNGNPFKDSIKQNGVPSDEQPTSEEQQKAFSVLQAGCSKETEPLMGDSGDEFEAKEEAEEVKTAKERKKKRHIKKLETILESLRNEIEKCQEQELSLEEMDEENSSYIYEDKLKKKFVEAWNKLCEVTQREPSTGRPTEKTIKYMGTRYKEINKRLERFINRRKIFPDIHDVKAVVKSCNKKKNLHLSAMQINDISREAFVDIGEMLQIRRHKDFIATFGNRQTDQMSRGQDPYLTDPELRRKLDQNRQKARSNLDAVIEKYVKLQKNGVEEEDDEEEDDEEEGEEGDEEQVEAGSKSRVVLEEEEEPMDGEYHVEMDVAEDDDHDAGPLQSKLSGDLPNQGLKTPDKEDSIFGYKGPGVNSPGLGATQIQLGRSRYLHSPDTSISKNSKVSSTGSKKLVQPPLSKDDSQLHKSPSSSSRLSACRDSESVVGLRPSVYIHKYDTDVSTDKKQTNTKMAEESCEIADRSVIVSVESSEDEKEEKTEKEQNVRRASPIENEDSEEEEEEEEESDNEDADDDSDDDDDDDDIVLVDDQEKDEEEDDSEKSTCPSPVSIIALSSSEDENDDDNTVAVVKVPKGNLLTAALKSANNVWHEHNQKVICSLEKMIHVGSSSSATTKSSGIQKELTQPKPEPDYFAQLGLKPASPAKKQEQTRAWLEKSLQSEKGNEQSLLNLPSDIQQSTVFNDDEKSNKKLEHGKCSVDDIVCGEDNNESRNTADQVIKELRTNEDKNLMCLQNTSQSEPSNLLPLKENSNILETSIVSSVKRNYSQKDTIAREKEGADKKEQVGAEDILISPEEDFQLSQSESVICLEDSESKSIEIDEFMCNVETESNDEKNLPKHTIESSNCENLSMEEKTSVSFPQTDSVVCLDDLEPEKQDKALVVSKTVCASTGTNGSGLISKAKSSLRCLADPSNNQTKLHESESVIYLDDQDPDDHQSSNLKASNPVQMSSIPSVICLDEQTPSSSGLDHVDTVQSFSTSTETSAFPKVNDSKKTPGSFNDSDSVECLDDLCLESQSSGVKTVPEIVCSKKRTKSLAVATKTSCENTGQFKTGSDFDQTDSVICLDDQSLDSQSQGISCSETSPRSNSEVSQDNSQMSRPPSSTDLVSTGVVGLEEGSIRNFSMTKSKSHENIPTTNDSEKSDKKSENGSAACLDNNSVKSSVLFYCHSPKSSNNLDCVESQSQQGQKKDQTMSKTDAQGTVGLQTSSSSYGVETTKTTPVKNSVNSGEGPRGDPSSHGSFQSVTDQCVGNKRKNSGHIPGTVMDNTERGENELSEIGSLITEGSKLKDSKDDYSEKEGNASLENYEKNGEGQRKESEITLKPKSDCAQNLTCDSQSEDSFSSYTSVDDDEMRTVVDNKEMRTNTDVSEVRAVVDGDEMETELSDSEAQTGVNDSDAQTGVNDSDAQTGVNDSDAQTGVNDSDAQTGVNDSDAQTGVNGNEAQTGVNGNEAQTGVNGNEAQTGVNGNEAQTGVNGNEAQTGVNGNEAQTGVNGNEAQTGVNGNEAQTGVNGNEAQTGVNDSDAQTGVNGNEAQTGVNDSDAQTGVNGNEAQTGVNDSDAQTGVNGNEAQTGVNDSDAQTGVNGNEAQTGVNDNEAETRFVGEIGTYETDTVLSDDEMDTIDLLLETSQVDNSCSDNPIAAVDIDSSSSVESSGIVCVAQSNQEEESTLSKPLHHLEEKKEETDTRVKPVGLNNEQHPDCREVTIPISEPNSLPTSVHYISNDSEKKEDSRTKTLISNSSEEQKHTECDESGSVNEKHDSGTFEDISVQEPFSEDDMNQTQGGEETSLSQVGKAYDCASRDEFALTDSQENNEHWLSSESQDSPSILHPCSEEDWACLEKDESQVDRSSTTVTKSKTPNVCGEQSERMAVLNKADEDDGDVFSSINKLCERIINASSKVPQDTEEAVRTQEKKMEDYSTNEGVVRPEGSGPEEGAGQQNVDHKDVTKQMDLLSGETSSEHLVVHDDVQLMSEGHGEPRTNSSGAEESDTNEIENEITESLADEPKETTKEDEEEEKSCRDGSKGKSSPNCQKLVSDHSKDRKSIEEIEEISDDELEIIEQRGSSMQRMKVVNRSKEQDRKLVDDYLLKMMSKIGGKSEDVSKVESSSQENGVEQSASSVVCSVLSEVLDRVMMSVKQDKTEDGPCLVMECEEVALDEDCERGKEEVKQVLVRRKRKLVESPGVSGQCSENLDNDDELLIMGEVVQPAEKRPKNLSDVANIIDEAFIDNLVHSVLQKTAHPIPAKRPVQGSSSERPQPRKQIDNEPNMFHKQRNMSALSHPSNQQKKPVYPGFTNMSRQSNPQSSRVTEKFGISRTSNPGNVSKQCYPVAGSSRLGHHPGDATRQRGRIYPDPTRTQIIQGPQTMRNPAPISMPPQRHMGKNHSSHRPKDQSSTIRISSVQSLNVNYNNAKARQNSTTPPCRAGMHISVPGDSSSHPRSNIVGSSARSHPQGQYSRHSMAVGSNRAQLQGPVNNRHPIQVGPVKSYHLQHYNQSAMRGNRSPIPQRGSSSTHTLPSTSAVSRQNTGMKRKGLDGAQIVLDDSDEESSPQTPIVPYKRPRVSPVRSSGIVPGNGTVYPSQSQRTPNLDINRKINNPLRTSVPAHATTGRTPKNPVTKKIVETNDVIELSDSE